MRIQKINDQDKVREALEVLGLTNELIELSEEYMDAEDTLAHGKPEFFAKLPKINLKEALGTEKCSSAFQSLKKNENKKYASRFVDILYGIGGATVKYVLYENYYSTNKIQELTLLGVPLFQAVAIQAEDMAWKEHLINNRTLKELYQSAGKDINVLKEALKGCEYGDYTNTRLYLSAIYFYYLREQKKWKPSKKDGGSFLSHLPIYDILDLNEEDQVQFKMYEGSLSKSLDVMYRSGLTEEEEKRIVDYIEGTSEGEQVPVEFLAILNRGKQSEYITCLLVGSAFLNFQCSNAMRNFLKIAAAVNLSLCMEAVQKICSKIVFEEVVNKLDTVFQLPKKDYIVWLAQSRREDSNSIVKRFQEEKDDFYAALHIADIAASIHMTSIIKNYGGKEDTERLEEAKTEVRKRIADSAASKNASCTGDIIEYMLGRQPLSSLLERKEELKKKNNYFAYDDEENLADSYAKNLGCDDFYERLITFLALVEAYRILMNELSQYNVKNEQLLIEQSLRERMERLDRQGLPLFDILHFMEAMLDYFNYYSVANSIKDSLQSILRNYAVMKREELLSCLSKLGTIGRSIVLTVFAEVDPENDSILLQYFNDGSKQIKEMLVALFADKKERREAVLEKLASKKLGERETAVLIIDRWNDVSLLPVLEATLETEKSKKLVTLLQKVLHISMEDVSSNRSVGKEEYVKDLLKGNRKRSLDWLYETPMLAVHLQNKEVAAEEYMQAVLLSYATCEPVGVNPYAFQLTEDLNKRELSDFANAVFEKWIDKGAEAKKKWIMYFASTHGGEEIVNKLNHYINEWPKHGRGAIAAEAVRALAVNGSPTALVIVDGISRKFKFRQVKDAASSALEFAAVQLNMSIEELADKIVPNLGFSESFERIFDYGARSFHVYITPSMELELADDKGKKIKSMPSPGAKDDPEKSKTAYEEFKQMKKQMKTTVTNQKLRLELALSTERKWKAEAWEALFVKNPIMHQFAISLIWGCYSEGSLSKTFRYMEDGTFNTEEEEEYQLEQDSLIGLVHPLELSNELCTAWKEQLSDYEIVPSIEQLDRPVFQITEEEKNEKELERFGGYIINGMTLSGKIMACGWYRGSILDGGGYYTFFKEDKAQNVGVEIEFSGLYVGGDFDDTTIYEVRFYHAGTVSRGSYVYEVIKPEDCIYLKDVPERFFSETVYQITKVLASSTEKEKDWKKKNR